MRRHVLRLAGVLRRAWDRHCLALATAPDPHGQFPSVPLDWYLRGGEPEDVHIPRQRTASR